MTKDHETSCLNLDVSSIDNRTYRCKKEQNLKENVLCVLCIRFYKRSMFSQKLLKHRYIRLVYTQPNRTVFFSAYFLSIFNYIRLNIIYIYIYIYKHAKLER